MAKNQAQTALPAPLKPRGRPPLPGGPKSQREVQRDYRARIKAAGKVVRLVDPAAMPDPASALAVRDRDNALLNLALREKDIARLEARNADLESKLSLQGQRYSDALKEIKVLKQQTRPAWRDAVAHLQALNATLKHELSAALKEIKDLKGGRPQARSKPHPQTLRRGSFK